MTTKPRARRFRLRLSDEGEASVASSIAPATASVTASSRAPSETAAASRSSSARPPQSSASVPASRGPAGAGLFDENEDPPPSRAEGQGDRRSGRGSEAAPSSAGKPPAPTAPSPQPARKDTSTEKSRAPVAEAPPKPVASDEHSADAEGSASADAEIEAIRAENLSGRQLRMAMRVAQRHGVKATTGLDAVRLLRRQGIDPFERSTMLEIVKEEGEKSRALTTVEQPPLPKAYRQPAPPATTPPPSASDERKAQISRIQRDIARRRRRRMVLLASRLAVFVMLPTLIAAWYFYTVATPLYATYSEFNIQSADSAPVPGSAAGLAGALGGSALGGFQESNAVQSFLRSREAMRLLDRQEGFKAYFQQPGLDPLRRLAPDATDEAAYRLYEDMVRVSYDPTEGIIRMEVIAADPATSERFARALVTFAEEQVDQLTQRLRENQLSDSMASLRDAEARFNQAQMQVLELQERYQVLSSEVEVTLLTQQITGLETQLNQERLGLSDLLANARPNTARLEQARRRIDAIETQIAALRAQLTQGGADGMSLARVQRELTMAESDVATRQMMLAQAMQQLEAARIEANRQVRYLALSVSPVAPDEPAYPRAFENTALAFLIFAGIYLMVSMTAAILREQVTG